MKTTIEIEVEVEYTYDKGTPGYLSGPPERCYPPEAPSAEIAKVMFGNTDITDELTSDQIDTLGSEAIDHAQNEIADRDIP